MWIHNSNNSCMDLQSHNFIPTSNKYYNNFGRVFMPKISMKKRVQSTSLYTKKKQPKTSQTRLWREPNTIDIPDFPINSEFASPPISCELEWRLDVNSKLGLTLISIICECTTTWMGYSLPTKSAWASILGLMSPLTPSRYLNGL